MQGKVSSSSPWGPETPQVSNDAFYEELLGSCTRKLEAIEKNRDEEKELRYSMLGIPLPDSEEKSRNLEVRGIARFHLADKHGTRAAEVRAQALHDLLEAKALKTLCPEAAELVEKLEAAKLAEQEKPEHIQQHAAASSETNLSEPEAEPSAVNGTSISKPSSASTAMASKLACTRAATASTPSMATAATASETCRDTVPSACKPAVGEPAAVSVTNTAPDSKPSVHDTASSKPSGAKASESLLDIDLQHSAKGTVILASPADGVEVDVADGTVRFSKGDKTLDVPVNGVVTGVRRRRGRLEVSIARPEG